MSPAIRKRTGEVAGAAAAKTVSATPIAAMEKP
jgi:hypothetical protein